VKGYGDRQLVVSCHVERPLDDRSWSLFSRLQQRRPGGLAIAALIRPPDPYAGEDEERWLARAREAAGRGPLGHHTHWTAPGHARPTAGGTADRVRYEGAWIRSQGLVPTLFCGGGWYIDSEVAEAAAELGYADCTATAFAPSYLPPAAPRASLDRPARLRLPSGARLLELPTTHSIGMAARSALGSLRGPVVHVYFHDTDLLDPRRRAAVIAVLAVLSRRARPTDLDRLREKGPGAPELDFSSAASAR
jgi:hypothetical protein